MAEYKARIESESPAELEKRMRNLKVTKYAVLSISILTLIVKCYIEYLYPNIFIDNMEVLGGPNIRKVLIAGIILRIMHNIFMMFYAIRTIAFFLIIKFKNITENSKKLTNFNILIIFLMVVAFILRTFALFTIDSIIIARL